VSAFDNKPYLVQDKKDKLEAANTFARVSKDLNDFKLYLNKNHPGDYRVDLLNKLFDTNNLREAIPKKNQTSYSINKGEKIVICIRTRDKNDNIVDFNTIMFVSLHELAHVCTISIGHKTEFWDNFKWILANAIRYKIYKHVDYSAHPEPYCNIKITNNPLAISDIPKYTQSENPSIV
jgi:hypothetical protein